MGAMSMSMMTVLDKPYRKDDRYPRLLFSDKQEKEEEKGKIAAVFPKKTRALAPFSFSSFPFQSR